MSGFAKVIFCTEHLTIFQCGSPAFAPRHNVIRVHLVYLEVFIANWAVAVLLSVFCLPIGFQKCS